MAYLLTLPADLVQLIAIFLFLTPLTLSLLLYWISKTEKDLKINHFVTKVFITPPSLEPLRQNVTDNFSVSEVRNKFTQQLGYRLLLIYGGIFLVLLGSMIGEFYLILVDVSQEITQGISGEKRVWSNIVFTSPFDGGWLGYFPWYGNFPLPPINFDTFHDPWSWILFTAARTDNPFFLNEMVWQVFYGSIFCGILFLIPLLFSFVRKSFVPSLFFFLIGMMITTKGFFSCFSQAFKLEFASGSITYGVQTITKETLQISTNLLMSFILPIFFIILIFYVFFLLLGRSLWRSHYPTHHSSYRWFVLFLSLCFWGSLFVLMV